MGVVYRARDLTLHRDVALKFLTIAMDDLQARARVLEEARTISALNHPNICTIYEVGEAEGRPYLAMEYIEGHPLSQEILSGGVPVDVLVRYGVQLADALAHAHERGIVHRDLKAGNVIVTPSGRLKVLDFGLSRRVEEQVSEETTQFDQSWEDQHSITGTLPYIAPELLNIATRCGVNGTGQPSSTPSRRCGGARGEAVRGGVVGERPRSAARRSASHQPPTRRSSRRPTHGPGREAGVDERTEREDRRGRVAPGHRDDPADRARRDAARRARRPRCRAAPATGAPPVPGGPGRRVGRGAGPPRGRRAVDPSASRSATSGADGRGAARRRRARSRGAPSGRSARRRGPAVGRGERRARAAPSGVAGVAVGGRDGDLKVRVRRAPAEQLAADVAGRTGDPHPHPRFYAYHA